MPWATIIDPDGNRPKLIGSRWERRAPVGDAWDGPVQVVGVYEVSEANGGGIELCIACVEFGQPVQTADAEAFGAAYKRVGDDDPTERLTARLRDIEARR